MLKNWWKKKKKKKKNGEIFSVDLPGSLCEPYFASRDYEICEQKSSELA